MNTKPSIDHARLFGPDVRRTPEMQAIADWLAQEDAGVPDWLALSPAEGRALSARLNLRWNEDLPPVSAVAALSIPGTADNPAVPAQMIVPEDAEPGCILYIHGGGWAFCDLESHQRLMRSLAIAARTRVLAVDYRLAPEHPYPAPLSDCVAAWRWLRAQAASDPALRGPLAVGGDSAGANLALGLILAEGQHGRPTPDGALLFYGIYAADLESPSYLRFAKGYGLTQARMRRFWDWYAAPEFRTDPLVSPIEASEAQLAKLPPLFLNAAGLDPLLSDTLAIAEKLDAADADYTLVLHEGLHHGFMQMSSKLPAATEAIEQAGTFYRGLR